jgi:mannose/fructose/N-acetylgalactosamine-specific phosphotransferase system component IID
MPVGVILSAVALAVMAPNARLGPSMLWGLLGYILAGLVTTTALIIID